MWVIKDWKRLYERAESRKLEYLTWIAIPNKHDGKGFRRLMRMEDGLQIFGCFIVLAELASKAPKDSRGSLVDPDGPLTIPDMADSTGMLPGVIGRSLEVLCSKEIGWMLNTNPPVSPGDPLTAPGNPPLAPIYPPVIARHTVRYGTENTVDTVEKEKQAAAAASESEPTIEETGWPLFTEAIRGKFPTTDDHLIRKIVEETVRIFPPVTDEHLVSAFMAASESDRKQYSPALYVQTIPRVIKSWLVPA